MLEHKVMSNLSQITSHVFMVMPARFGPNKQTAKSNAFQEEIGTASVEDIQKRARVEVQVFVEILREVGIEVSVFEDSPEPEKADSVFPNNWISTHQSAKIVLYPMMAPMRRNERREDIVNHLLALNPEAEVIDLSSYEEKNLFLEGTGSMVLDRINRIAYACESPRTDKEVLKAFCEKTNYKPFLFHSEDRDGKSVYHTNVMMAVCKDFVVVCMDSITDRSQRQKLEKMFAKTGHEIIEITMDQMFQFAGNMLQVQSKEGKEFLIMSKRAHDSLGTRQLERLRAHTELLVIPIDVIETYGGGSVRCMLAEVF